MKPGPKPTPTPILKLRGSWRGKTRKDEPQSVVVQLHPPTWLAGPGRRLFKELAEVLFRAGITTAGDRLALALLCKAFGDFQRADAAVAKGGDVIVCGADSKSKKLNPAVLLRASAADQIWKGLACFGLTPADRSRVVPAGSPVCDKLDELIAAAAALRKAPHAKAR